MLYLRCHSLSIHLAMASLLKKQPDTVLLAIMPNKADYNCLQNEGWYRIPVEKAPPIIKNGQANIIAFYLTSTFKEQKWSIRQYGYIKSITEVSRPDLFPDEPADAPKAHRRYYKIEVAQLLELPVPITSRKGHRLIFVPTTEQRFFNHTDLNFLFNTSPLEDKLFARLKQAHIPAERQWWFRIDSRTSYKLDFAIFCKHRPINVECDGNRWHDRPQQVHHDKHRSNQLESKGWSVLRFTTDDIENRVEETMSLLYQTIEQNGGYC